METEETEEVKELKAAEQEKIVIPRRGHTGTKFTEPDEKPSARL